jgi:hypothetical protein
MRRSNLHVGFYLLLVFLSGVLVGGIAYRLYSTQAVSATRTVPRGAEEYRRQLIADMRSRLKVTDDQVQKINAILDTTREEYKTLHQRIDPELKAVQEKQTRSIAAILDDAQRAEFQKMREERAKRHSQNRQGHRP